MNNVLNSFLQQIKRTLPLSAVCTDPLRRLAWGTDAGFYRLIPQMVLFPETEEQVAEILQTACTLGVPATFRAETRPQYRCVN